MEIPIERFSQHDNGNIHFQNSLKVIEVRKCWVWRFCRTVNLSGMDVTVWNQKENRHSRGTGWNPVKTGKPRLPLDYVAAGKTLTTHFGSVRRFYNFGCIFFHNRSPFHVATPRKFDVCWLPSLVRNPGILFAIPTETWKKTYADSCYIVDIIRETCPVAPLIVIVKE